MYKKIPGFIFLIWNNYSVFVKIDWYVYLYLIYLASSTIMSRIKGTSGKKRKRNTCAWDHGTVFPSRSAVLGRELSARCNSKTVREFERGRAERGDKRESRWCWNCDVTLRRFDNALFWNRLYVGNWNGFYLLPQHLNYFTSFMQVTSLFGAMSVKFFHTSRKNLLYKLLEQRRQI